jgi:hypothetical protein
MNIDEKVISYSTHPKIKWWYWSLLILGCLMIVGGIVFAVIL